VDNEEEIKFKEEIAQRIKENPDAFKKTGVPAAKSKKMLDAQKALARKREMEKKKDDNWSGDEGEGAGDENKDE